MNCPNCHNKMEAENTCEVFSTSLEEYKRTGKCAILKPAAHYYCCVCDSEWSWIKGVKGIHMIDGADHDRFTKAGWSMDNEE